MQWRGDRHSGPALTCTLRFESVAAMPPTSNAEFARAWPVILAAAVGVGLGTTGLPIYTTGLFILPLHAAFGWSRSATEGALIGLTVGGVLMAPLIGAAADRFGVRRVALASQLGLCLGYLGLAFNGGSLPGYYIGWAVLSVLGAGTSPIVWTKAVASWFEQNRGLALGLTLCGTGLVAIVGPAIIGGLIAAHGWRAGFIALAAAQLLIGWPLTAILLRTRERPAASGVAVPIEGTTVAEGRTNHALLAHTRRVFPDRRHGGRADRQPARHSGRPWPGAGPGLHGPLGGSASPSSPGA